METISRKLLNSGFLFPKEIKKGPMEDMPERIIQFGEGNFLRAFVDWMIDEMNIKGLFKGRVVVVQPIKKGLVHVLNQQEGLYTLLLRGIQRGKLVEEKRLISSISRGINPYTQWQDYLECAANPHMRFMVSNTTEAGISYVRQERPVNRCPDSFPAKVTAFLYERYVRLGAAHESGMIILPCELIDNNGDRLKHIVLRHADEWGLEQGFSEWINKSNYFLNTLVDRIVTGFPKEEAGALLEEWGYEDRLLDTGEIFHLWVIEGDKALCKELPLRESGLNVIWTGDLTPYRTRKVRILNGAHTMTVPVAYLCGKDTVRQCVEDPLISRYMEKGIFEEILPTLDLPEDEKKQFAADVLERFENPYIRHLLVSISLNSVSKWKVRVLPSVLEYIRLKGNCPDILCFSLAALIVFYRVKAVEDDAVYGYRDEERYEIKDQGEVLEFFTRLWMEYERARDVDALCRQILGREDFWGMDLNKPEEMANTITAFVRDILDKGMQGALKTLLEGAL